MLKLKLFSYPIFLTLSAIVFLFSLSSCNNSSTDNKSGNNIIINESGRLVYEKSNELYTGNISDTLGGKIVSYEVKDGLKDGKFTISYSDSTLEVSGTIRNNKNEGKWNYYYQNGNLESEGLFKNDQPHSKWIFYYPNGNKKEEGNFLQGKRDGIWLLYNEDETVKGEVFYKNGASIIHTETKRYIIT